NRREVATPWAVDVGGDRGAGRRGDSERTANKVPGFSPTLTRRFRASFFRLLPNGRPRARAKCAHEIRIFLVLPDRIELSTSPLPRECSTTALRQSAPGAANRRPEAGPACHKGEGRRKRGLPSRPLCATTLSAIRKSDTDRKQERVE